jgi:nucleoside permease NupC
MLHLQSALGIITILFLAWAFSEDRRAFPWRSVAGGLLLQAAIALLLLNIEAARNALFALNGVVDALSSATSAGTSLVFGYISGAPAPFAVTNPAGLTSFAFGVLPLVLVIAALSALLWHWRVLPVVVGALGERHAADAGMHFRLGLRARRVAAWCTLGPGSDSRFPMGTNTVLNELIAYLHLASLPGGALDARTTLIMLYALCGFANPGSVGILIAGRAWCRSGAMKSFHLPCGRCFPALWQATSPAR